jgi:hypothetical protein
MLLKRKAYYTQQTGVRVTCIEEVLSSILGVETSYPD